MAITPKNWKDFQHYKDRAPAWIKLHKGLIDDYVFACLPVDSRALAPLLWLLASEYEEGKITASVDEIGFRLRMHRDSVAVALKPLIDSEFFIDDTPRTKSLANEEPRASLEREGETEKQEKIEGEGEPAAAPPPVVKAPRTRTRKQPDLPGTEAAAKKPTRLPDDWKMSHADFDYARSEGLTELQAASLAKEFRNYWLGAPGAKGLKQDWPATWRNKVLSEVKKLGIKPPPAPEPPRVRQLDEWKKILIIYASTNNWLTGWGPQPGAPGCLVPKGLLPEEDPI